MSIRPFGSAVVDRLLPEKSSARSIKAGPRRFMSDEARPEETEN
jgi:hypothetical protein